MDLYGLIGFRYLFTIYDVNTFCGIVRLVNIDAIQVINLMLGFLFYFHVLNARYFSESMCQSVKDAFLSVIMAGWMW